MCFSTCTGDDFGSFVRSRPTMLTDRTSPWLGYLSAVYHESVRVPFNLSRLTFYYMPNGRWSTIHPGVQWPMSICRRQYAFRLLPPSPNVTWCERVTCERWARAATNRHTMGYSDKQYAVGGIGYPLKGWPEPAAADATSGRPKRKKEWPPANEPDLAAAYGREVGVWRRGSGWWIEVIRVRHGGEGESHYGCWFYQAPGSGIWLRLGNATRNGYDLASHWLRRHGMSSWADASRMLHLNSSDLHAALIGHVRMRELDAYFPPEMYHRVPYLTRPRYGGIELGPFMAKDAGFNTFTSGNEIVALSDGCMHGRHGMGTNRTGGCVPHGVGLRTGQRANLPCHCDTTDALLNCDGQVGERRRAHRPAPTAHHGTHTPNSLPPLTALPSTTHGFQKNH